MTVCETFTAVGVGIGEAGHAGARRVGRAGGLLVGGTAEEHLRIGALEDACATRHGRATGAS